MIWVYFTPGKSLLQKSLVNRNLVFFFFSSTFGGSDIYIISKLQVNNAGITGNIVNEEERGKRSVDQVSRSMLCRASLTLFIFFAK
jgi:hypothetical protein